MSVRERVRNQVKRIHLHNHKGRTTAHLRIVHSPKGEVKWAITGLKPALTGVEYGLVQDTPTREPCSHSDEVVGYILELLDRMRKEAR